MTSGKEFDHPITLRDAAREWQVSRQAAWHRLNRGQGVGALRRVRRGLYIPVARAESALPPDAEAIANALQPVRSFRWAISGLDLLTGFFHYLPARYPHLVLIEPRGVDYARRALVQAGILTVGPAAIGDVWAGTADAVVVLRPGTIFRGVPKHEHIATPERAFLDVLVEVRHRGFPYPLSDLVQMWREAFTDDMRRRIAALGTQLHVQPFVRTPIEAIDAHSVTD